MITMTVAKIQLLFFNFCGLSLTFCLASVNTAWGMSLIDSAIRRGTIIKLSISPMIGIKSGSKSIGLNRQLTVNPIRIFAVGGVRLSAQAKIKTCASDFNCVACFFNLSIKCTVAHLALPTTSRAFCCADILCYFSPELSLGKDRMLMVYSKARSCSFSWDCS